VSLVVSDSGPVHYLVLCEAIEILPKLYDRLVIPAAVARELTHRNAPAPVAGWIRSLPQWASVQGPSRPHASLLLGPGEREAIALALELKATQLLVDDRVARQIADQKGLSTAGTIGVLEQAAKAGILNLPPVMQKLLDTNFRIDAEVVREVLNRDAARRKAGGQELG
jgi:predicted nucleic acid-binding protein